MKINNVEFAKEYAKQRKREKSKISKCNSILRVLYYTNPIYGILGDYDKYKYYNDALKLSKKLETIISEITENN